MQGMLAPQQANMLKTRELSKLDGGMCPLGGRTASGPNPSVQEAQGAEPQCLSGYLTPCELF